MRNIKFNCEKCGKDFERIYACKTYKPRFCSIECSKFCMKGILLSEEHKNKIKLANLGKPKSDIVKRKISKACKGKKHSEELKLKWSKMRKGKGNPRFGTKLSEEIKKKISISLQGKPRFEKRGEKCYLWKGGISQQEGYTSFNAKRYKIRKRNAEGSHTFGEWQNLKAQYNWTCPACKKSEPEIKLTEDHIIPLSKGGSDNIENIQPLCGSCNNYKRTKIIKFFA